MFQLESGRIMHGDNLLDRWGDWIKPRRQVNPSKERKRESMGAGMSTGQKIRGMGEGEG
jgi:hypothetical protein